MRFILTEKEGKISITIEKETGSSRIMPPGTNHNNGEKTGATLIITIKDNGEGIDDARPTTDKFGLMIMRMLKAHLLAFPCLQI
jgi:two-component sensor histidine kinase